MRRTGGAGDAKTEKPWNCSPLKDSETSSEFPPSFDGESPSDEVVTVGGPQRATPAL